MDRADHDHIVSLVREQWKEYAVTCDQELVQPLIAAGCARTLAYNRAGYLGSDNSNSPRDSATIVEELRGQYNRVADDEVRDFLARLVAKRWVELDDE